MVPYQPLPPSPPPPQTGAPHSQKTPTTTGKMPECGLLVTLGDLDTPDLTLPILVLVSTLQASLSWERFCVKHSHASMGGAPRGKSSTCDQSDNCPALTK